MILLLTLAALGWFWLNSLRILEAARAAAKQACRQAEVQFLDDTVARSGIAITRTASGQRALRRTYRFEFSETGDTRLDGQVVMLGDRIESLTMSPYRILP
ncbi:MAG: DUF3301 domain-containing protein [Gallionella sp.]|nr:DUF3301 domain-containing protein [Gallionella sp.]